MRPLTLAILILTLIFSLRGISLAFEISGSVSGDDGGPIEGVTVTFRLDGGQQCQVYTDSRGVYSVASGRAVLEIRYDHPKYMGKAVSRVYREATSLPDVTLSSIEKTCESGRAVEALNNAAQMYLASGSGDILRERLRLIRSKAGEAYPQLLNNRIAGFDIFDLLSYAIKWDHRDIVELLISQGMASDIRDGNGSTPLHLAVQSRNGDIARLLIDKGADIDARDYSGRTPLHIASRDNCREMILLLLSKGADKYESDNEGKPALGIDVPRQTSPYRIKEGYSLPVTSIGFSPGGRFLVSGARDGILRIWSSTSGKLLSQLTKHRGGINSLVFSPGGSIFASASDDGTAIIWKWKSEYITGDVLRHSSPVRSLCFSSDGRYLITGCADGTIAIWILSSGEILRSCIINASPVNSLCLSPDNKHLVAGSQEGTVAMIDFPQMRSSSILSARTGAINTVCMSQSGRMIASGDDSGQIVIRELPTGEIVKRFRGHDGAVCSLVYTPGGRHLLSGGADGALKSWDTITWNEAPVVFRGDTGIRCVRVSPGGRYIVVGCEDGSIRILSSSSGGTLATLIGLINGEWISLTPDLYFDCSPEGPKYVLLEGRGNSVTLDQYRAPLRNSRKMKDTIGEKITTADVRPLQDPPIVRLISPANGASSQSGEMTLRVEIGHGVKSLQVLINGRPARTGIDEIPGSSGEDKKEIPVPIKLQPGANRIEVTGINEDGVRSLSETVTVQYECSHAVPSGRLFLLAVGINDYGERELKLDYAASDARAVEEFFREMKGLLFRDVKTISLVDSDAGARNIMKSLKEIGEASTDSDLVIVFLAGHGMRNENEEFFFLCPGKRGEDQEGNSLSWTDFRETLTGLRAKNILLLIDACHSGSILKADSEFASNESLAEGMLGVIVYAACRGNERSCELPGLGGAFTQALISGLHGRASAGTDGRITLLGAEEYVSDLVPRITDEMQHPILLDHDEILDLPLSVPEK